MNSAQLEELLVAQNPHWRDPSVWEDSLRIKRDYFPSLWDNLTGNRLVAAVSGPRRVGKSYLLRQLMAEIVRSKKTPPQNILYFPFAANTDEKDIIRQAIDLFLRRYANSQKGKIYIFFDEIQFISFWPEQIKFYYDQDPPIKFVVTGSTSLFYRQKSRESLLGRMMKFSLGVLSFGEYLRFRGMPDKINGRPDFFDKLPLFRSEFRRFLFCGQLPEMAAGLKVDSKEYLLSIADQLVNFDIPYFHSHIDRTLFTNLVKTLSFELANEVSFNRLSLGLETTRQRITEYARILEETGYFGFCLNGFFRKMRAKFSASKKLFALNTNLALAINGFDISYLNDSRVLGHYAENYVYLRLREKYGLEVEYYADGKKEADFLTEDAVWEVKYGQTGDLARYREIAKKLKRKLIIVTENEMDETSQETKIPIYLI